MSDKRAKDRKKRGRPPLPAEEGKRFPLSMRTTKAVRESLHAAADQSGRSIAQEVEHRLERSFQEDEARYREFGGEDRYRIMKWLALSTEMAERVTDKSWTKDRETFRIAVAAMQTMLEQGMPASGGLSDEAADDIGKKLGASIAEMAKNLKEQE